MSPKNDIDPEYKSLHIEGRSLAEPYIVLPNDIQLPEDWTLAECKYCGYRFPVSNYYTILLGTKGWTCPRCAFNKTLHDARKKEK